jgi:cell division protein FtsZ
MADDVLYQGVKGVTDLMVRPGLINLDFADVRAVMDEMGKAMMGTGEASGEDRAVQAAEKAIANPLLDEISLNGAKGVLINITGGYDLTLFELDEAANIIREKVDPDANIIVGSTLDTSMEGRCACRSWRPASTQAPRPAGTPSPEAMERLQAAVRRAPAAEPRAPRAPEPAQEKPPRFGINSLINRMTGHPAEPAPRPQAGFRQQPQLRQPAEEDELSPEQEKIEIPAFLRRQAN